MTSPTPSRSDSESGVGDPAPAVHGASALALSGLLKVQRRWSTSLGSSTDGTAAAPRQQEPSSALPAHDAATSRGRRRLPVHLESAEWSRLAVGIVEQVLGSMGVAARAEVIQLDPDSVTVHLPVPGAPPWPFVPGRLTQSWQLPRDSQAIAAVPLTPAIASAARKAALVTFSEAHGRRALVDLVALSSTLLRGDPALLGAKLADIAVELGSRRWSDLESLILVAFDRQLPRVDGARHAPHVAAALEDVAVRSMSTRGPAGVFVIVPPWAGDPGDPLLAELVRFCEQTDGAGILSCASPDGALCRWELADEPGGQPALSLGDGRRILGVDLTGVEEPAFQARTATPAPGARTRERPVATCPASPIEVAVLGNVQVNGATESLRYRRRLTELVAFLAMHPEGVTTDTFATALWPDRRVPVQTLANRLSETRRALGPAGDGRPACANKAGGTSSLRPGRTGIVSKISPPKSEAPRGGEAPWPLSAGGPSVDWSAGNGPGSRASRRRWRLPSSRSPVVSATTPSGAATAGSPTGQLCRAFSPRHGTRGSTVC